MPYLVQIDNRACAAHGDCVEVAPEVFALDDIAVVIGSGAESLLLEAAEACPSAAILLIDSESGDQAYP